MNLSARSTVFVQKNQQTKAIQLAENLLKQNENERVVDWLIDRYLMMEDYANSLRWQIKRMHNTPTFRFYSKLKDTAQQVNQWETVRPRHRATDGKTAQLCRFNPDVLVR